MAYLLADVRAWLRDWRAWVLILIQVALAWLDVTGILERSLGSETWEYLAFFLVLAASVVLGRPTLSVLLTLVALGATAVSVGDESSSRALSLIAASALSGALVTALAAYVGMERARAQRRASLVGAEGVFGRTFTQHQLPMLAIDPADGRIQAANPAAENFYGFAPGTLATLHGNDLSATGEDPLGGQSGIAESVHRLADGSVRVVEVFASPTSEGGRTLMLVTVHDITSAARHRREVARSRQLLAATLDAEPDLHVVLEPMFDESGDIIDFRYVEANERACSALRRPRAEVVGHRLSEVIPGLVASPRFATYCQVVHSGEPVRIDAAPADEGNRLHGFGDWYDILIYPAGEYLSIVIHDATQRVEAAHALERSQADYRLLSDTSADVVFRTVDGEVTYISPAVTRLLGYQQDELIGTHGALELHPDDHADVERARSRPSPDGVVTYVARLRRKDRTYVYCEVQTRSVDRSDSPHDVVGSIRDVTLRMAERNERERVMESLHQIMAALPDAWVVARAVFDETGTISDFLYEDGNELAAEWHGMPLSELLGNTVLGAEGPEGKGDVALVRSAITEGRLLVLDDQPSFVSERLGRGLAWIDIRVAPLPGNRILYSWRDVTERHQTTAAMEELSRQLAESETTMRALVQAAPAGTAFVRLNRTFAEVNNALAVMIGRDPDWLLAHSVDDILSPADLDLDRSMRDDIVSGRAASRVERKTLLRSDGSTITVLHSIAGVPAPDGTCSGFVSQFIDISDRADGEPDSGAGQEAQE